jgi:hypothetical protein
MKAIAAPVDSSSSQPFRPAGRPLPRRGDIGHGISDPPGWPHGAARPGPACGGNDLMARPGVLWLVATAWGIGHLLRCDCRRELSARGNLWPANSTDRRTQLLEASRTTCSDGAMSPGWGHGAVIRACPSPGAHNAEVDNAVHAGLGAPNYQARPVPRSAGSGPAAPRSSSESTSSNLRRARSSSSSEADGTPSLLCQTVAGYPGARGH